MKGKVLLGIFATMICWYSASADITVNLPENCDVKTISYYYAPIKQFASANSRSERGIVSDSVSVSNSKAVIPIPKEENGYMYGLIFDDNNITLYSSPVDNVTVDVVTMNPFNYSLSGSDLADGMNELLILEAPIEAKAEELSASGQSDSEEMNKLREQYTSIQKDYINSNPEKQASLIALMNLDGKDFISVYETLPANLKSSILFPLVEKQYSGIKKSLEMEKKQQALQSGEVKAPNFTLKDLEGKDVSLSDFKGKWVILDFWGSWCPWCIKGFPELKEAYNKYAGKLEIIGVDCKESESDWKAGVEKYQLPWVNVYNPEGTDILNEYGVQGFPTKAIIDPEGKIRNITVGHDPNFFNVLSELMDK